MTPAQKDEALKWLVPALIGGILGGGAGFGSSQISAGEVTVKLAEPVKAELPPSQIELLKDASSLGEKVGQLSNQLTAFLAQYASDQRENRATNDQIRAALAQHNSDIGVLKIQVGGATQSIVELRNDTKSIEGRVREMENREAPGIAP